MNVKAGTHRRMVQKASVHQGGDKRHARPIAIVGRIASVLSVCMYFSGCSPVRRKLLARMASDSGSCVVRKRV